MLALARVPLVRAAGGNWTWRRRSRRGRSELCLSRPGEVGMGGVILAAGGVCLVLLCEGLRCEGVVGLVLLSMLS